MEENILDRTRAVSFIDFADISFLQLYIISLLISLGPKEPIRFELLNQINDVLFKDKPISPSKFYNEMNKLKKKGLIDYQEETGNIKRVKGTSLAKRLVKQFNFLMLLGSIDFEEILTEILPELTIFTKMEPVQSFLIIHFQELLVDVIFRDFYLKYSKELYILATDQAYERYIKRGVPVHQSRFHDTKKMIREVTHTFDATFLVRYHPTTQNFGLSERELLKEGMRVTKSKGKVIIIALEEIPFQKNVFLEGFRNSIQTYPLFPSITEERLRADLTESGLNMVQLRNFGGLLVGWGINP
ncbi:hypothetical protein [Candidatus Hodarchaeum mangrovi]